jgi:hypothetical protein
VPEAGTVDVTGYYVTGDYYKVYINTAPALTTTQVIPVNVDYGDQVPPLYTNPSAAFSSGLFSTGTFNVNAGDLITIADLYLPSGIGEVGRDMTPEPSMFMLFGLGLIGIIVFRLRLALHTRSPR